MAEHYIGCKCGAALTAATYDLHMRANHRDPESRRAERDLAVIARIGGAESRHRQALRDNDAAQLLEDCDDHPGEPHTPAYNDLGDAWCERCGERLLLTGFAGGPPAYEPCHG